MGVVALLVAAAVAGLLAAASTGQSAALVGLLTGIGVMSGFVLPFGALVVYGWFRLPVRRHWEHGVGSRENVMIFYLKSLHDGHARGLFEIRLRVDAADGTSATAFTRKPTVRADEVQYVRYPDDLNGASAIKPGMEYRYNWSARQIEDGPWVTIAEGQHTGEV